MLTNQVPVLLLYWTAEAGEGGVVQFRNDLYGRDSKILNGLKSHFSFHSGKPPGS
jgi:murein L,D-transpeptidase YcbB/YkuD